MEWVLLGVMLDPKSTNDIGYILVISFLSFIFYGTYLFFIAFIAVMFILDFILMDRSTNYLELKLLIEWGIVSIPAIGLGNWVLLLISIAFLFLQFLRGLLILKIIGRPLAYFPSAHLLKYVAKSLARNINYAYICYLLILLLIGIFVLNR